jgi:hypothetical protein
MDEFVANLPKIASIFSLAFFSFWPAIPAGLALGLSPLAVISTTTASYAAGVALVTLFGERVRNWILKRLGRRAEINPEGRLYRIWSRYGIIGLGLLAPMTVGAQIGAALGLALNSKPRGLFIALSLGALAWSIGLTAAVSLGVAGLNTLVK